MGPPTGDSLVQVRDWLTNDQVRNVVAGAGAGVLTAVVTCPLDVLKTRLQFQATMPVVARSTLPVMSAHAGSAAATTTTPLKYRGIKHSLVRIFQEEGIRGLYRGLGPTLLGYFPTWTVYFGTYDEFKGAFSRAFGKPVDHPLVHLSGAVCAGTLSTMLCNPLWVIKARMQTQGSGGNDAHFYRSTWHAVRSILRKEGGSAFYKGIVPSLFGITHVAVQFPLYEFLKRSAFVDQLFRRTLGSAAGPSMQGGTKAPTRSTTSGETAVHVPCMATIIFASTASKLIASSTTYPVGERCFLYTETTPPKKYFTLLGTLRTIVHEETWRGLYKGLGTNLVRTVPASAVTLLSYETLMKLLTMI